MSWLIQLIGTNNYQSLSSDWNKSINSVGKPAYTSGLSFTKNGTTSSVAITGITAGTDTTITKVGHGLISGDFVQITGTSTPADWQFLTTTALYYYVVKVDADNFKIYDLATSANTVTFEAYGCQPHIIDESEDINYWAGGFRKLKKGRLGFDIKLKPFVTRGDYETTIYGHKTYWDLRKVMYDKTMYIYGFGNDYDRIEELMVDFPLNFQLPIQVEVMEFGELSAEFENNLDRLNIKLASTEWFDWTNL